MLYTGIDYHRKYSVLRTLDAAGNRVKNARIDHQQPEAFAAYFANLPDRTCAPSSRCSVTRECWRDNRPVRMSP